jgi:hypothetical protein
MVVVQRTTKYRIDHFSMSIKTPFFQQDSVRYFTMTELIAYRSANQSFRFLRYIRELWEDLFLLITFRNACVTDW